VFRLTARRASEASATVVRLDAVALAIMPSALVQLSATELSARVRSRDLSCREVIEAHAERVRQVNPKVNAITVQLERSALSLADEMDRAGPSGALAGVPFTVKESIDCVGSATTLGVPALSAAMPFMDAPAVARLKAAGAIVLGRTNMSEMGMRIACDNPLRGRTKNPWNAALTPGGSSGGDAVAVACGMVPLGLGNDMGGSLRAPAHACGVCALKPTTGRIAHASSIPPEDSGLAGQLMMSDGPIARRVRDLRLALSVMAGRDVRDPRSVDAPLTGPPPAERRAALITSLHGAELPPAMVADIERAGNALARAGYQVEHATAPELPLVNEVFSLVFSMDFGAVKERMRPILSDAVYEHLGRITSLHALRTRPLIWLHAERSRLVRAWSGLLSECSVLVGPTWAAPVWPVDADLDPDHGVAGLLAAARFLSPGNVLGLPCVALPVGAPDANGAPGSVQIYADLWREDLCLDAAEIVETSVTMPTPIDPR
jgi:amidase